MKLKQNIFFFDNVRASFTCTSWCFLQSLKLERITLCTLSICSESLHTISSFSFSISISFFCLLQLVIAIRKSLKPAQNKCQSFRQTIVFCTTNWWNALRISFNGCRAMNYQFATLWTVAARRTIWHCDWLEHILNRKMLSRSISKYFVIFIVIPKFQSFESYRKSINVIEL